jgi:hypothetical protein
MLMEFVGPNLLGHPPDRKARYQSMLDSSSSSSAAI